MCVHLEQLLVNLRSLSPFDMATFIKTHKDECYRPARSFDIGSILVSLFGEINERRIQDVDLLKHHRGRITFLKDSFEAITKKGELNYLDVALMVDYFAITEVPLLIAQKENCCRFKQVKTNVEVIDNTIQRNVRILFSLLSTNQYEQKHSSEDLLGLERTCRCSLALIRKGVKLSWMDMIDEWASLNRRNRDITERLLIFFKFNNHIQMTTSHPDFGKNNTPEHVKGVRTGSLPISARRVLFPETESRSLPKICDSAKHHRKKSREIKNMAPFELCQVPQNPLKARVSF